MKVVIEAMKHGMIIDGEAECVSFDIEFWNFKHGNHDSLALAVLRAASAVLKARGSDD